MKAFSWSTLYLSPIIALVSEPSCHCLYGQPCWPSNSEFSLLADNLSQPLIHPVPLASACYPAFNTSLNCSEVVANFGDPNWRSDQPGQMQNPNFESLTFKNGSISGCYLNTTLGFPCEQGSVSPVGVDARSPSDVQIAVKFASKHNLRLVLKNTGHDYLGRSTANGSFMIWTHHMKNITYNATFIPDGAPPNETHNAITLGAGVQWHEAYDAVEQQKRFMVGGISVGASVGAAGGWISGGGHSAFAIQHGLGVDNVIQFTVVTANGDLVVANAHQHSDLFWALRGGGGGTFGVIISATYRTHESFPLTEAVFLGNFSSPDAAKAVVYEYLKLIPSLVDQGMGGYISLSNTSFQFIALAPNMSSQQIDSTFQPFLDFASNITNATVQHLTQSYSSFYELNLAFQKNAIGQVGGNIEIGSRLVSQDLVKSNPGRVADIMLSIEGGISINLVAGGAVSTADPDSTGLNPAWRKTYGVVYFTESWPEGASGTVVQQAQERIRKYVKVLDPLSVDSGAYFNEASMYEENFQKTFFGSHYEKLETIKAKYDPQDLFVVVSGVGSEKWDDDLVCRRR